MSSGSESAFRDWVLERPEPGRYHLYVSLACPWAHRTIIVRALKRLEEVIVFTVVDPLRDERGWRFLRDRPDPITGFRLLSEAYLATDSAFDGRVTVPVLWDVRDRRIVNNESSEIIRMLDAWSDDGPDLYPEARRAAIDGSATRRPGRVTRPDRSPSPSSTSMSMDRSLKPPSFRAAARAASNHDSSVGAGSASVRSSTSSS